MNFYLNFRSSAIWGSVEGLLPRFVNDATFVIILARRCGRTLKVYRSKNKKISADEKRHKIRYGNIFILLLSQYPIFWHLSWTSVWDRFLICVCPSPAYVFPSTPEARNIFSPSFCPSKRHLYKIIDVLAL